MEVGLGTSRDAQFRCRCLSSDCKKLDPENELGHLIFDTYLAPGSGGLETHRCFFSCEASREAKYGGPNKELRQSWGSRLSRLTN